MSTPFTSPQPDMPTGTSNPVSWKSWFTKIGDWIKALSPPGAAVYDTGWLAVTALSGSTAQFAQARRIGTAVYFRGQLGKTDGTAWAAGVVTIGTVPAAIATGWEVTASARTVTGNTTGGIPRPLQAWISGRTITIYQDSATCSTAILSGLSALTAS